MRREPLVVGVFDAGVGGIPIAALLQQAGLHIVYLGDSGRRPYGPQTRDAVGRYVAQAERFFAAVGCDAWVIACNTASVVADAATSGLLPRVDMVGAVAAEFPRSGGGPLGLLATAGTVKSGAFPRALPSYNVHQIATEDLLRLAEEGSEDHSGLQMLAGQAFDRLRALGCTTAVLACTDFTCIMPDLEAVAGGLTLVDPLHSAVRLVLERLAVTESNRDGVVGDRLVLTGPHPVDVQSYALTRFGLTLPAPDYVDLGSL